MKTPIALRNLAPLGLLLLLAACDRPHAPPPPTATAAPAAPATVSLSGAILEPQPASAPARPAAPGAAATARRQTTAATYGSGGRSSSYQVNDPLRDERLSDRDGKLDNQALRDFQVDQEQRDRELLERDMDEARTSVRDDRPQEREDNQPYDLPPEDGDWTAADDGLPPNDDAMDEPPLDDGPPLDDEPLPDDRYYDPRDSGYRR